jgi:Tol biopolymer transport system component
MICIYIKGACYRQTRQVYAAFILSLCTLMPLQSAFAQKPNITVTKFRDSAFASAWSRNDSTLVAYNAMQPNGYFGIYTAHVSADNKRVGEQCITCGNTALPGKNIGDPDFQPTGKYILFIAEKAQHPGSSANSVPGIGTYSDVWAMTLEGKKATRLTNTPNSRDSASGVIFSFFSPNGKKIMWTEMVGKVRVFRGRKQFGSWVIKTADFIDDSLKGPHLANIKVYQPGGVAAFNEAYGWSPDGSQIIFASCYNQFWVWDDQIYTMDTLGGNIKQLTSTEKNYPYNEHAFYTPDGKKIVWMTNREAKKGSSQGGDDWWMMNADSTNQHRLTYFNDTASPYWTGATHINGHGSFSPDGKRFIGDVGESKPIQLDADAYGSVYIINLY